MDKWFFPTRGHAETEGFSNAGLAEFKGNPLQALAREVCQNSLDASDGSGRPVRVEFHKEFLEINSFPGMEDMRSVIEKCNKFWGTDGDANTKSFLTKARRALEGNKFFVLRVSDYNTKGVQGAFSDKNITPWGGLVKGNSFSVKTDEKNAQGSFGIGKAAPFVSSAIQTIFYRTYDMENVRATLGVARLMAHEIPISECMPGEDPVRRSVGYYGENEEKKPSVSIEALDNIYERTEYGTDLFIPAFAYSTADDEWIRKIMIEIVDSFLYSIYSGKLEVVVEDKKLTKATIPSMLQFLGAKAKNAMMFYDVIREDNSEVIEETRQYYELGQLRLRLLYKPDMNKKVLVVRNSGMKIATIPNLPKGMSYVGFFELQGDKLNEIFRGMENPKHNAWEPKRHDNPSFAKKHKEEVEDWVRDIIIKKLIEKSGEEALLDVGDCFNYKEQDNRPDKDDATKETIVDTVQDIIIDQMRKTSSKTFKLRDQGGDRGTGTGEMLPGTVEPDGNKRGHRHRTGSKKGLKPTGRAGKENPIGVDKVYPGTHEVDVSARIISRGKGVSRLIFNTFEDISLGEMEIVTKGENGKALQLYVQEVNGRDVSVKNGHIVISSVKANEKHTVEFKIAGNKKYAMGVRAYGN